MWSCAMGHMSAACALYRMAPVALRMCNHAGLLPTAVATMHGHTEVVHQLDGLENARRLVVSTTYSTLCTQSTSTRVVPYEFSQ